MQSDPKDLIYAQPHATVADFQFDDAVTEVFPDMIQRSIPGYNTIIDGIGQLGRSFVQPGSNLYDLGCSLGAASLAIKRYLEQGDAIADVHVYAIDNSATMVERCQRHLAGFKAQTAITVLQQNILEADIAKASVVVMNFTLQFIDPAQRASLLTKIFNGMRPGGLLILSEKLQHPTALGNAELTALHHEFKRRNGYSELEISQKRTALENVMKIDSFQTHQQRLLEVGFRDVVLWFKCFNFSSMFAVKA